MWSKADLEARTVRYRDLRPCYNAFIDTRTPGSEAKENFTIIGPGVSENPAQHVHIAEPHGFNIGGARQPPGCVNSQHSHETAEVFVVHTGRWRFDLGETGQDAQVEAGPGDVISLPTRTFRGFTNIGEDVGFLWSVLGGDDPGRVTWAPCVFEVARDYGLVLMEDGSLVDTAAGGRPSNEIGPMPPTTREQASALRRFTPEEAERLVVSARAETAGAERPLIGPRAPLGGGHGFTLSSLTLNAGERTSRATPAAPEVLFIQDGAVELDWRSGDLRLEPGDTITLPAQLDYALTATCRALIISVRREAAASAQAAA